MTDWFRSWHGAPTDNKWLLIGRKAGVAPGIVAAIAWALFDHASQASNRGDVSGFDAETYAVFSGFDETAVRAVLAAFTEKGIIASGRLAAWDKRQPKREREDNSAERVKAHRERKSEAEQGVTEAAPTVTPCNATKRLDTEERREEEKDTPPPLRSGGARARRAATRLPEDWEPDLSVALAEGMQPERAARERDKFRDHWRQKDGPDAVKRDWPAAWRNWCRNAVERFAPSQRGPPGGVRGNGYLTAGSNLLGSQDEPASHTFDGPFGPRGPQPGPARLPLDRDERASPDRQGSILDLPVTRTG